MEKKKKGVVLAAPKSGSGKTFLTCALIQAITMLGEKVTSYKCGPDYIDPMFHRSVLGVEGANLDTFFMGEKGVTDIFYQNLEEDSYAVVEGVMGLFDGLGGTKEEGSTYHIAACIGLPVILILDAHGMGRSVLAELTGFLSMDKKHLISGVILNRVSDMFYPSLKKLIEQELSIKVFGYMREEKEIIFSSRHLGLMMPSEIKNIKGQIQKAAKSLSKTADIDEILSCAEKNVIYSSDEKTDSSFFQNFSVNVRKSEKTVLAVARDEAFCFYYRENLKLLEEKGFLLRYFSPIHDKHLPKDVKALLLGGGYPELYAKKLSQNSSIRNEIKEFINHNHPSLAECGGFMYLHDEIEVSDGISYPMAGVISGKCTYKNHLVRFGYISMTEKESIFLPKGEQICGHEFHYCDSSNNGIQVIAKKPTGSRTWECIHESKNHFWGFPHLYYPSNPHFIDYFKNIAEGGF